MLNRISIPSPNYSSRDGNRVRLIVLHTAEGARTIRDLGGYFSSVSVQASSQSGADDTPNTIGQFVADGNKAWAVAAYNNVSVNLELCAFAAWTTAEWMAHPNMLANCAQWIAEEAKRFGIPIVKLTDAQAQGSSRGVCQHSNLGAAGGGHHDCGPGFPIDHVLDMAKNGTDPHHYAWFDTTKRLLLGRTSELALVQEYDRLRATQTPTKHPNRARLAVLRKLLRLAARRVWVVSHAKGKPSWGVSHRGWRWQELTKRAQGKSAV